MVFQETLAADIEHGIRGIDAEASRDVRRDRDQDAARAAAQLQDARVREGDKPDVKGDIRAAVWRRLEIVIAGGALADVHEVRRPQNTLNICEKTGLM